MSLLSNLSNIGTALTVNGPFWSAAVEIVGVANASGTESLANGLPYAENFAQYAVNQHPVDWLDNGNVDHDSDDDEDDIHGVSTIGDIKSPLFKTVKLADNIAYGTTIAKHNLHSHYSKQGVLTWTNYRFSGRMYITDNGGIGVTFYSRYPEKQTLYYRLRRYQGKPSFQLTAQYEMKQTLHGTLDSGIAPTFNTWYRFLIDVETTNTQTNIKAKVWKDGEPEPTNFQMNAYDNSPQRLTSGAIGLWVTGLGNKYFDDLQVNIREASALRNLFVDNTPRKALDTNNVLLPGTMLALCAPQTVVIKPGGDKSPAYSWHRLPINTPPALTIPQMRNLLATGQLSLLLLQADPTQWPTDHSHLPAFTCLAGEINLDQLQPDQASRTQLFQAVTLQPVPLAPRPGAAALPGALSVHSSGVTLYGSMHLPWQAANEQVTAPFQLARLLPDPGLPSPAQPGYRLTVEVERLIPAERDALITAWRNLSIALNPRHPLNGNFASLPASPTWVTLEITNPLAVPRLYWQIVPWQAQPAHLDLHFEPGGINLILSDQQPYDQDNPPTSLATVALRNVAIKIADNQQLQVLVEAGAPLVNAGAPLAYTANMAQGAAPAGGQWQESFQFPPLALTFDPLETPQFLREQQNVPTPDWIAGAAATPLPEPLLWGALPLEDGWAQLPVPNLTEQIYLDALPETADQALDTGPILLQGAVALGNDRVRVLGAYADEQAWNVTLTDSAALKGTWTLTQPVNASSYALTTVKLDLYTPEVTLNGFFWFSTGAPTAADALPDLADGSATLHAIPLIGVTKLSPRCPPLITITLPTLAFSLNKPLATSDLPPSAQLNAWSLQYQWHKDNIAKLAAVHVLPTTIFDQYPPLIWRRHAQLPMIQVLPLTQTQSPPNHPSASRQFAPFELDPATAWTFGVTGINGANAWPQLLSAAIPAKAWRSLYDLPLTALSLPGLVLDPNDQLPQTGLTATPATLLPVQYRFDLPYTDEINALAQLPKDPRNPNEVSPLPASPPPQPPQPLQRATFAAHWQQLSDQASLASVDAVAAFVEQAGRTWIRHLIEPFAWPVHAQLTLDAYPGGLTIDNEQPNPAIPSALELKAESALKGIGGHFSNSTAGATPMIQRLGDDQNSENPFIVRAGSMETHVADHTLRDQRGLVRSLSQRSAENPQLIATAVTLEGDPSLPDGGNRTYQLLSLLEPLALQLFNATTWRFWFRDLPVATTSFQRKAILSSTAQDVNDPQALTREQNYRAGYEWRLGLPEGLASTADNPLMLNNLAFYPLTLEQVRFNGAQIVQVDIVGRLQLPLAQAAKTPSQLSQEQVDISNAVRLTFTRTAAATLELSAIQLESALGEWPLELKQGEQTVAPRLEWNVIRLEEQKIVIGGADAATSAKLRFFLFDTEWSVPIEPLTFESNATPVAIKHDFGALLAGVALGPQRLTGTLDLQTYRHSAALTLALRLGNPAHRLFEANAVFALLAASGTTPAAEPLELTGAQLLGRLPLTTDNGLAWQFTRNALQVTWTNCAPSASTALPTAQNMQFLPGMELLLDQCPGFFALTFAASAANSLGLPTLAVRTCFVELLLTCHWGEFLQTAAPGGPRTAKQVFGSSAGELVFGYTTEWQAPPAATPGGTWDESLLVNGFLEAKSLISWPSTLHYDEAQTQLTLPAFQSSNDLAHVRHTLRILFNQHQLPAGILKIAKCRRGRYLPAFLPSTRDRPGNFWR